jgi:peptidoglycan/xylan/chitin deacetylase (PgdA/CDA1 family)
MVLIMLIRKQTAGLYLVSFLFMLLLLVTTYSLALHPNMENWRKEKVVIDEIKTNNKVVALTFDDGPDSRFTPMVLDILKKHEAQATFFVIGQRAQNHPQILKRIAAEGHEIGNHSFSHPDFNRIKKNDQLKEIKKTNNIIKELTGQTPRFLRPPGGYLSYDLITIAKQEKLLIGYWTYQQDSKDWHTRVKASTIANHVIRNVRPGQIIILHDGCPNSMETARATDLIISRLKADGYRFVTLSELIMLENK